MKTRHSNIDLLSSRMESALQRQDYSEVLHASASIFETLAKDIIGSANIQNQTSKGFFERYEKDSLLPKEVLNFILNVYDLRNKTPLAGHGSTQTPNITRETAIALCEMTKAFVEIEYKLHMKTTTAPEDTTEASITSAHVFLCIDRGAKYWVSVLS